ncbi:MAG: FtsW/RodA/SpoVE family cell cycle protein [Clostridia bacterium]|nr:FtsW/RodA/SpoVE family cell cycle protein [Clostridia bacterium]
MAKSKLVKPFRYFGYLLLVTVFQLLSFVQVMTKIEEDNAQYVAIFLSFLLIEWFYVFIMRSLLKQKSFELELIAFFLSGIGLSLIATVSLDYAMKQLIYILAGVLLFLVMRWLIANSDRVTLLRLPAAVIAAAALAFNLVAAQDYNGAKNWVQIGSFSIQPSEFVKIAFIFVGAATLDKLQTTKSVFKYLVFAAGCIGALFLMRDFGTALIFFATFLIIAYMRSGDWKTIAVICVAAVLGAILIISFKSTVAARFATYRHIWDTPYEEGMQQTRVLIYSASGGLFGVGLGNGRLRDVYAETTDLIFGMVCEEYGLLVGFIVILAFAAILVYTIASAKSARTSFYVIAACSAAGLLIVQTSLNVFGVTDLLPWTGVTLPFVSRGGSSMMSCWALLAFIKSVDPRAYPKTLRETQITG